MSGRAKEDSAEEIIESWTLGQGQDSDDDLDISLCTRLGLRSQEVEKKAEKREIGFVSDLDIKASVIEIESESDTETLSTQQTNCSSQKRSQTSGEVEASNSDTNSSVIEIESENDTETLSSQMTCSPQKPSQSSAEAKAAEKNRKKLEREKQRKQKQIEKQLEKDRLKANKEVLKSDSLKECLKYCVAVIDTNIFNSKYGNQKYCCQNTMENIFAENDAAFKLTDKPIENDSVSWIRKKAEVVEISYSSQSSSLPSSQVSVTSKDREENDLLIILPFNELIPMISSFKLRKSSSPAKESQSLFSFVYRVFTRHPTKTITVLIYGIEIYFKKRRQQENKRFRDEVVLGQMTKPATSKRQSMSGSIERVDIEEVLIETELKLHNCQMNVNFIKANSANEVAMTIFAVTKAVASAPYRNEKHKKFKENFSWFIEGDKRATVDPKTSEDMKMLWKRQLMQFHNLSRDVAEAIAKIYPTIGLLIEKYRKLTKKEGEDLLKDVLVARNNSTRRIGQEISRQLYIFCMTKEQNQHL